MKAPRPEVLRRGCVMQVAGNPFSEQVPVRVVTYGDIRYQDGHIERWYGSGTVDSFSGADGMEKLVDLGTECIDLQGVDLVGDMGREFENVSAAWFNAAPIEIVVQWNADVTATEPPLRPPGV